jgi:hypothetical protein
MIFDEISFHDSVILSVTENTKDQTLDFELDYFVDWENQVSEKKVLQFQEVIFYVKKEIPFAGMPTILEIKQMASHKHTYKNAVGSIEISRYKIEMITNAGSRFIEFSDVSLLDA